MALDPEGIVPGVMAPVVNDEPMGASTQPDSTITATAAMMAKSAVLTANGAFFIYLACFGRRLTSNLGHVPKSHHHQAG